MKQIIEEYGGSIAVFIVIIALIAIFAALLASNGVVAQQFQNMINTFFSSANGQMPQ